MSGRAKLTATIVLAAALVLPAHSSAQAEPSYAIAASQITELLAPSLAEGVDYRLALPAVVSRVESPKLKVEAKTVQQNTVRLRIACAVSRECLPFYVSVHFASTAEAREFASITASERHGVRQRAPMLVRGGSLAKLEVVVSGDVRLYFYVRCLQSGAVGDRIRARDEKTHKIYLAQVVEPGELRSEL